MKEHTRGWPAILCFLIMFFIISPGFSCKKEQPPRERKAASQPVNPYSTESVFFEVKNKLRQNPDDADAWYHLADLYNRNGQYTEAIDSYKRVLKLKPGSGYVYFKLGTAYDRLNKPEDAVQAFKKAVRYMPEYAVAYNNLGVAYGRLGKTDEEMNVLRKAIKLRPRYAAARYNLGIAYLKMKNEKAAMQQYESLKDIDTGIADSLLKEVKGGHLKKEAGKKS